MLLKEWHTGVVIDIVFILLLLLNSDNKILYFKHTPAVISLSYFLKLFIASTTSRNPSGEKEQSE